MATAGRSSTVTGETVNCDILTSKMILEDSNHFYISYSYISALIYPVAVKVKHSAELRVRLSRELKSKVDA